ncbi:MAG: TVP38/TMEM64 family protein [Acidiferrobacterales bacterium]
MDPARPTFSRGFKFFLVALILVAVVILNQADLLDVNRLLTEVRANRDSGWLILALILAQVVLYTFALGGSYALWLVGPVYAPVGAAAILAIGGTLGAISAYYFSKKISDKWIRRIENSRTYRLLQEHNGFYMVFALRVLPGFPHGLISYSAGVLNCRPVYFILASLAGFAIKFYLYANIVYHTTDVIVNKQSFDILSLSPLIILSALSLITVYVRHRMSTKTV